MVGSDEPITSCTAPSAAVQVRVPAQQPRVNAGLNLNTRCPIHSPRSSGSVVAIIPAISSIGPTDFSPAMNEGAALIPTTAMNVFRPI